MTNEFTPYDIALALKELDYDEPSFGKYPFISKVLLYYELPVKESNNSEWMLAPLYQQAFKWFREKYGLNPHIKPHWEQDNGGRFIYRYGHFEVSEFNKVEGWQSLDWWLTYEEAELACLKKLIEIVKENKED